MGLLRRTLHEYANELDEVSSRFRVAYCEIINVSSSHRVRELRETSELGIELLRVLSLTIRSEQDSGLLPESSCSVGSLIKQTDDDGVRQVIENYRACRHPIEGFRSLSLREGCNKIAHADQVAMEQFSRGFFADHSQHDLFLLGRLASKRWFAILSISDFCKAVMQLPDIRVRRLEDW